MANEATVQSSLTVRKLSGSRPLIDQRLGGQFQADVAGTKGPSPGAVTVTTSGTDVDLSELTQPGLVVFSNQDATNYVEVGIREPGTSTFYPFLELLPGESYAMRFSRNLARPTPST
jgi:hypothetical protein